MGILQLFPQKDFYVKVSQDSYCQGQFCWLPVPHIDPVPRILDVERSSPTEHGEVNFILRNANQTNDFTQADRNLPIKMLKLRATEELLVQRAKKRPGVIVSSPVDVFPEITRMLRQMGKSHLQQDSIFLVPAYSIESEDNSTGFPIDMVSRIRCLMFRQFFYFPSSSKFREGIARFDRIQVVVSRDRAAIVPTDICLSGEVCNLFIGLFQFCITGIEDEDIHAVRGLCREAYATTK
jgi:hypothetical protein